MEVMMNKERQMILEMVSNKRITTDEALILLKALGDRVEEASPDPRPKIVEVSNESELISEAEQEALEELDELDELDD
jgi:DUF4097 and DUF4098 domain-containing protein YvlB